MFWGYLGVILGISRFHFRVQKYLYFVSIWKCWKSSKYVTICQNDQCTNVQNLATRGSRSRFTTSYLNAKSHISVQTFRDKYCFPCLQNFYIYGSTSVQEMFQIGHLAKSGSTDYLHSCRVAHSGGRI